MAVENETYEQKLERLIRYYERAHKMGCSRIDAVTTASETKEILEAMLHVHRAKNTKESI